MKFFSLKPLSKGLYDFKIKPQIKMRNKTYKQYCNRKEAKKENNKKEEITLYVGFVKKGIVRGFCDK